MRMSQSVFDVYVKWWKTHQVSTSKEKSPSTSQTHRAAAELLDRDDPLLEMYTRHRELDTLHTELVQWAERGCKNHFDCAKALHAQLLRDDTLPRAEYSRLKENVYVQINDISRDYTVNDIPSLKRYMELLDIFYITGMYDVETYTEYTRVLLV